MTAAPQAAQVSPPDRIRGAAAWRFVLTCALAGPPLGYVILAILLALMQLSISPSAALDVLLGALLGIAYLGVGILMAYIAGVGPATLAGLLCLWWFNRRGELSRAAAAGAGLVAGVALVALFVVAMPLVLRGQVSEFRPPSLGDFAAAAAVIATSGLSALIIAPVALRRAEKNGGRGT